MFFPDSWETMNLKKKKTIKSVSAGKFANIEQQRQVTEHGN